MQGIAQLAERNRDLQLLQEGKISSAKKQPLTIEMREEAFRRYLGFFYKEQLNLEVALRLAGLLGTGGRGECMVGFCWWASWALRDSSTPAPPRPYLCLWSPSHALPCNRLLWAPSIGAGCSLQKAGRLLTRAKAGSPLVLGSSGGLPLPLQAQLGILTWHHHQLPSLEQVWQYQ